MKGSALEDPFHIFLLFSRVQTIVYRLFLFIHEVWTSSRFSTKCIFRLSNNRVDYTLCCRNNNHHAKPKDAPVGGSWSGGENSMGVDGTKTEGQTYSNEDSCCTHIAVRPWARDGSPSDSVSPRDRTYPPCCGGV